MAGRKKGKARASDVQPHRRGHEVPPFSGPVEEADVLQQTLAESRAQYGRGLLQQRSGGESSRQPPLAEAPHAFETTPSPYEERSFSPSEWFHDADMGSYDLHTPGPEHVPSFLRDGGEPEAETSTSSPVASNALSDVTRYGSHFATESYALAGPSQRPDQPSYLEARQQLLDAQHQEAQQLPWTNDEAGRRALRAMQVRHQQAQQDLSARYAPSYEGSVHTYIDAILRSKLGGSYTQLGKKGQQHLVDPILVDMTGNTRSQLINAYLKKKTGKSRDQLRDRRLKDETGKSLSQLRDERLRKETGKSRKQLRYEAEKRGVSYQQVYAEYKTRKQRQDAYL